jgi:stearoyl-CoA desaturase (delta-9 desaturase)
MTLAWMGSMGFQGSIKWWVLRHRLHHRYVPFPLHKATWTDDGRFTDSPVHDPYAATNGLWYSHCGWIFRKPSYPRMKMIERGDLESDPGKLSSDCHISSIPEADYPVVRFQHKHYVPIALFSGLILPFLIAHYGWNDGLGGLVWGGAVARLLIWYASLPSDVA